MPKPLGRGASAIKTPHLIREYLTGRGTEGDYVSRIHQAVKLMLRERKPGYHWPRKHSFHALVGRLLWIGLLEKTDQREDPQGRGAGVRGTGRGWRQRRWVRLVPEKEDDPLWNNPMRASTGVPLIGTPEAEPPPRRRPRVPAPEAPEEGADQELAARIERLNRDRQVLVQRLTTASETGARVEDFQVLHQAAERFLGNVRQVYAGEQFPDAPEAMKQLGNCILLFRQERGMTQRRVTALRNCQNWARLLAEALTISLVVPDGRRRRS